jgi:hypothetical protein
VVTPSETAVAMETPSSTADPQGTQEESVAFVDTPSGTLPLGTAIPLGTAASMIVFNSIP